MRRTNKIFTLMILIVLLLALASCREEKDDNPSSGSEGTGEENISYSIEGSSEVPLVLKLNSDKKSYTLVRSYSEPYRGDVVIPKEHNGHPITAIGSLAFYECSELTSVVIPDSICFIDSSAFSGCKALTRITVPSSVTEIGPSAFRACTSLKEVTLSEGITSIGQGAFANCFSLTEISLPESLVFLGASAFCDCTALTSVDFRSDTTELLSSTSDYSYGIFFGCVSLKNITLPKGLTYLPDFLFSGCTTLAEVISPDGVTNIGRHAFSFCTSLTSLTVPEQVSMIGEYAFNECVSLYEIINKSDTDLPLSKFPAVRQVIRDESESKIRTVDGFIFYDDNGDVTLIKYVGEGGELTLPTYPGDTKYSVATRIFSTLPGITGLTVPDVITRIDAKAFSDCNELVSIFFNCRDVEIDMGYFGDNYSVKRVYINTEDKLWCAYFRSLEEVHFGEGVTRIGEFTLARSPVKKVTVPSSVTEISGYAFRNSDVCELLIAEGSKLERICPYAFSDCSYLRTLSLPDSLTAIEERAFEGSGIRDIDLGDGLLTVGASAFDNCVFETIIIPDSLISIGEGAFAHNLHLSTVAIGEGSRLQSIGDKAFYCCEKLRTFTIPSELSELGRYVFVCSALSYISLSENNTYFEKIDACLYSEDKTVLVLCPQKGLSTVTVPASVKEIAPGAFRAGVNTLAKIIFEEGSQLERIGDMAFMGTVITEITIPATVTEIGKEAFSYCQSLAKVTFEEGTSLTELADGVFSDCYRLESITIPKEIVRLGEKAFFDTGIVHLYYGGTLEMWESIEKGEMWDGGMGDYMDLYTIHCADGDIEKKY